MKDDTNLEKVHILFLNADVLQDGRNGKRGTYTHDARRYTNHAE